MRIGTWNLEGKWSPGHLAFIQAQNCDVWLLTEVHLEVAVPGMHLHRSTALMAAPKSWSPVCTIAAPSPQPDPHFASARVDVDGVRFISSILPWRSCGASWEGANLADKMVRTLSILQLMFNRPCVWGGDWNQALEGPEYVGTLEGRRALLELTGSSGLSVPTRSLGSASPGHRSIDHVAVPVSWTVDSAQRVVAEVGGQRLSDHDAYVVVGAVT